MTLNGALKMRAAFDGDCFVDDVTLDTCRRCQANLQATQAANNTAIYNNVVGDDFAFNCSAFAYGQKMCADVAFDCTFNLNITSGGYIAFDCQVR